MYLLQVVINNKFTLINWHVDYLNNKFPLYPSPSDGRKFVKEKICRKNVAHSFVNIARQTRHVKSEKISDFNKIHFTLFSICSLISTYFSLQMFLAGLRISFDLITLGIRIFDVTNKVLASRITYLLVISPTLTWIYLIADKSYSIKCEVSIM